MSATITERMAEALERFCAPDNWLVKDSDSRGCYCVHCSTPSRGTARSVNHASNCPVARGLAVLKEWREGER